MDFRMKILMPNETLKRFHLPIKYDDNPHDQWDCRTHPFLYSGYFDEGFEVDLYPFCSFEPHILLLHPNYFK
jgi:hypothetical protein